MNNIDRIAELERFIKYLTIEKNNIIDKMKKSIKENENNEDMISFYNSFKEKFDDEIDEYEKKFNASCPEKLINSRLRYNAYNISVGLYLDLRFEYNTLMQYIYNRFPKYTQGDYNEE